MGEGPFDLVWTPGAVSNVELGWEEPAQARFRHALASFARLILFDKRGTGLSDRVAGMADLETRMDDIRTVVDAAGSERAAIAGVSEGGPMAILFAATHPERTQALVLYGSLPRFVRGPGFPWQSSKQEYLAGAAELARTWGSEEYARAILEFDGEEPTPERITAMAHWWRQSASPGAVLQLRRMNAEIDVRPVLELVQVPTAVMHRQEDHLPIEAARWMASQIPGAKMIELPGGPHVPFFGDWRSVVAAIHDFVEPICLAGTRVEHESVARDHSLHGHRRVDGGRRLLRALRRPGSGNSMCERDHEIRSGPRHRRTRWRAHGRVRARRRKGRRHRRRDRCTRRRACQSRGRCSSRRR